MKLRKIFICLILSILLQNIFAQDDFQIGQTLNGYDVIALETPVFKFVNTDDGSNLNFRDAPVDGKRLGSFSNGTKLKVTKMTNKISLIDGIEEAWFYVTDMEDVPPEEGWVFGGYLSDSDPRKKYLRKYEIDLNILIGVWENESKVIYIDSDGHFHFGMKESEGFSGTWSIRDDGTLYVQDCRVYDEEPWYAEYKIKVCKPNRLVLVDERGRECDLHVLTSEF